jgi:hypothetical protein
MKQHSLGLVLTTNHYFLCINLAELENCKISEVIIRLAELGYRPKLRYIQFKEGVDVIALLREEVLEDDCSNEEFEDLHDH